MPAKRKRVDPSTEEKFSFVVSTGPKLSVDPAVRSMIRRQAMKNASTERKLKGNYGKNNMIQYPIFLGPMAENSLSTKTSTVKIEPKPPILQPMPTRSQMANCIDSNKRFRMNDSESQRRESVGSVETKVESACVHGLMTPPLDTKLGLASYEDSTDEDRFEVTTPIQSHKDFSFPEPSLPESPISDTADLSDRTEMTSTLDQHMCSILHLIQATTSVLNNTISNPSYSPEFLLMRAHESRAFLSSWYRRWRTSLFYPNRNNTHSDSQDNCDSRLQVLGTYLSCVIIENRILTALDPFRGHEYELETQEVATRIMELYRIASEGAKGDAFMGSTMSIARSALRSAQSWCADDAIEPEVAPLPFFKTESPC